MILFWIAGFMFVIGCLNKCSGSESCLSKLFTIETLKLFFTWPYVLGKHLSEKCTRKEHTCCSSKENEPEPANGEEKENPQQDSITNQDTASEEDKS